MVLGERLKLTNRSGVARLAWVAVKSRSSAARDDEVIERDDRFEFMARRTAGLAEYLEDIAGMTAEATRSLPGRITDVVSVRPSTDRRYIYIVAEG